MLAASLLATGFFVFASTAAHAQAPVDVSNGTITCNTFLKGSSKFKPALSNAACPAGVNETIQIKGSLSDCTVDATTAGAGVVIAGGSVKGTITTSDCTCAGLGPGDHPIISGSLITSWKTASGSPKISPTSSTLNAGANIHAGVSIPPAPFSGAIYGVFSLSGTGVGVTGAFTGGDGGAGSVTAGASTESAATLIGECTGAAPYKPGLKVLTFGEAQTRLN